LALTMARMHVHLTEEQRRELGVLARATGKGLSELVREAVDLLNKQARADRRDAVLKRAAGLWKDRTDLPDFRALRRSRDRR
jgi:Arc/MetJ-type ribon-helix-helix transcriptional regulator